MSQLKLFKLFSALGASSLLFLTFFRENMLLAINALLGHQTYNRAYHYWFSDFFKALPFSELVKWKWGVTLFFTILMTIITIFSLYAWFNNKFVLKLLITVYGVAFILLLLIAGIGFLMNDFNDVYFILRLIIGIFQSPLPFFVFFVLFYWILKSNQNNNQFVK